MKSTYEIFPEGNLFRKTHKGVVSVDDEIDLLNRILADPTYRKGMNAVCDFSDASVNWSLADVDRFRAYISKIKHRTGKCKWGIVFPKGKDTSTARIFIALNDAFENLIAVKMFETEEEVRKWIEGVHSGE
jgi:hypothetical protein